MSEDLAATIEELIRTERGDVGRLQDILTAIKGGEPISFEDHQYVNSLLPKPESVPSSENTNIENDSTSENTNIENDSTSENTNIENDSTSENTNIENDSTSENVVPGPSPQDHEAEYVRRFPVKKYATVGIIIAIALVAYVGLDVYAINNLQFRPHHGQQVILSDTELGIQSDACNPSYFPATFTKYEIIATYNSDEIEKATINGSTLSPKSAAVLNGVFSINKEAATKIAKENTPFDPSNATITTSVHASIFGVVPYTVDKKYAAEDFQNRIKNPPPGTFDCYP